MSQNFFFQGTIIIIIKYGALNQNPPRALNKDIDGVSVHNWVLSVELTLTRSEIKSAVAADQRSVHFELHVTKPDPESSLVKGCVRHNHE